ncbi:MAG: circularly permuted type 2 ATP-grasp protein [Granulosicoccus sp.]|nr:circularly permuted type 2 ATP-grasp protein [Granulosicoccus sp.]
MPSALQRAAAANRYNETLHQDGSLLPGWQSLLAHIDGFTPDQRQRRQRDIVRQLRANGLAYRPENTLENDRRPWSLDLVPMLFEAAPWNELSAGLQQRARLKQALYQDIYGEQRLIKEGVVPAEMVYSHHGYLRDLINGQNPQENNTQLSLFSCDISRAPSGEWLVVDDVCQYPAGIGYALENRVVLSRVLPGSFRNYQVSRIVHYFRQLQHHVLTQAGPNSRCVLLGYPASHPHYFEFAWLAKYLGYTLVQSADLTVRDNHVYLKTVSGLQAVDSILRFIDDTDIDPLVSGSHSRGGVPGLVEAARRGGVRIFNPLGTGILDNPAFNSILPALCQALLNEPLKLQSPPTYWLGDAEQQSHVLTNVDALLFRHIDSLSQLLDPKLMTEQEKQQFIENIQLMPTAYVAQERVDRSVAPVLIDDETVQQQITIRTFQVSSSESFDIMPGGLCLLDDIAGGRRPTLEGLAGSKDVWVLSDEAVVQDSLLKSGKDDVAYAMLDGELPSRIAESMFWMGRNAERVEGTLRLLRSILQGLLDEEMLPQPKSATPAMEALLRAITAVTGTLPGFSGRGGKRRLAQPDKELISLVQDATRVGSLANALQQWQISASVVTERLSLEQLRVFNRLADLQVALNALELPSDLSTDSDAIGQTLAVLEDALLLVSASTGLEHDNVTHSDGWHFMMLGRRIERAHQISATVGAMLSVDRENQRLLEYLLRLFDSVMTYRNRYRSDLNNQLVIQLVLLDEINPRSLAYQFRCIQELTAALPGRRTMSANDPLQRLASAGLSRVRLADPETLISSDRDARQSLQRFLRVLQQLPASLADTITSYYFTHTESLQQLGSATNPTDVVLNSASGAILKSVSDPGNPVDS